MRIDIPYLHETLPLEIPDDNLIAIVQPRKLHIQETGMQILQKALYGSGGSTSVDEFLKNAQRVLVIVNDATRPTPTEAMLTALLPALEKISFSVFIATGAHRGPAENEYRQILGALYDKLRPVCTAHDARSDAMVHLGSTRNGTPVILSKRIAENDRIIVTGSVEPHYFAGFTGGRKAFLPGLAAFSTIEANHKLALLPSACSLALDGNPVHEDMIDALPLIKTPVFSLMTVLDRDHSIAFAASGDITDTFNAAVETARKIFCVPISKKAEVVISVARFPMDTDLYQSQKAIDNGALVLKDGGILILVSSCRNGVGDETYADLLAQASSPHDALERISKSYKLGYHKAAKMAAVAARAKLVSVSQLGVQRLGSMFIEKAASLQEAVKSALCAFGAEAGIIVLSDGCVTVPEIPYGIYP